MKKILSLVLAALMIFSVLPAAFAADVETIANIEETSEYAEAIKFLNTLKVYNGKANGDLAADEGVERWQAARFIYRVATGDVAETDVKTTTNYTSFKDINIGDFDGSSAETLGAIAWAAQAKITNGTAADKFSPVDGILYQDAITMIVRLLGERYTAASYPYGFVTTARELGILDGITGIGLEDEISRGVFAQLLYNAIFAPVYNEKTETYETLAEKVFDVKKDIVLITASNKVFYETTGATVLNTNYVGFKTLNTQGEPTGNQFHAKNAAFGLADATAANAAVGTAYAVYHTGNFEAILSAESLTKVYWNKGNDVAEVAFSSASSGKSRYLTIAGEKYQVVDNYAKLLNKQAWTKDAAGNDQVKLYVANGGNITVANGNSNFFLDDAKNVWQLSTETGLTLYATYIPALNTYYREVEGQFIVGNYEDIVTNAGVIDSKKGFSQKLDMDINKLAYHSAYAQYVVTDASADGYADRITMKQYSFGKLVDYGSLYKDSSSTKEECFLIKAGDTAANSITTIATDDVTSYDSKNTDSFLTSNTGIDDKTEAAGKYARVADYRWTGVARKDVPEGAYILYYIDNINKEIDVYAVISGEKADANDDTYLVTGYIRNLNVAQNAIYMSNGETYTIGYNTLANSPLVNKDYRKDYPAGNYTGTNYSLVNNVKLLQPMLNTYKTLVVVDNKVVYIAGASANKDFVILDSFVDFAEDAIVARAYTTVTDEYTDIKIKAFNGWTVGNFDYYLYFLSNLMGNSNYANSLPFDLYTTYQVVEVDADGYYNLTTATPVKSTWDLAVNEYGYITGTNGSNGFSKAYYKLTNDADYWLILDTAAQKVYNYKGKLNPMTLDDVDVYKATANDYVLVAGANTDLSAIDGLFGGSVSYYVFNYDVAMYYNDNWLNNSTVYDYQFLMTNVLTGATEAVSIDPALVSNGWAGLYNPVNVLNALQDGKIYKVIQGVLYADAGSTGTNVTFTPVEWSSVVAYYDNAAGFKKGDSFTKSAGTRAAFLTAIAEKLAAEIYPNWETAYGTQYNNLLAELDDKVTLYVIDPAADNSATTFFKNFLTKDSTKVGNYLASGEFTVYYVIKDDNSVVAWAQKN